METCKRLYDKHNAIIATLHIKSNGDMEIYSNKNCYLGRYCAENNITYDWHNSIVGKGNLTSLLIGGR